MTFTQVLGALLALTLIFFAVRYAVKFVKKNKGKGANRSTGQKSQPRKRKPKK